MSNEAIRLVRLRADQIDTLETLWLTLHRHHQRVGADLAPYVDEAQSWQQRRKFYRDCFAEPRSFCCGAYAGDSLVGYALVRVERASSMWTDTWVTDATTAEIESLVVDPAFRGKGIGTRLMDAVDEELAALGITDVIVGALPGNSNVLEIYRRRGFAPTWLIMTRFAARKKEPGL
jgi:ribosomal protein S18 acetylase RimI-like enzyme